ncbi:MAG: tyrosine-type recombinase/integrase, partial [Alphaproteobacteria bacterium]|nr:tyrosine-type recombinase/integrase [Alphaproteobacteria bacterium]
LLAVAFSTGLRVTELLTLPYSAVTGDKPYAIVRGKGEKERIVIISDDLKAALKDYKIRRFDYSPKGRDSIWLFPSRGASGHLTRAGFFKMLKLAARKAGLDQSLVSPHILRHSFATYMLQNGADLRSLQKLLGHSSIATTEIYTHLTPKTLADTVMQKHPLAGGAKTKGKT